MLGVAGPSGSSSSSASNYSSAASTPQKELAPVLTGLFGESDSLTDGIFVHLPDGLVAADSGASSAKRKRGQTTKDRGNKRDDRFQLESSQEWSTFPRRVDETFTEPAELAKLRFARFNDAWQRADTRIKSALHTTHTATLSRISNFVSNAPAPGPFPSLPTLLITTRSPAPTSYLPPVLGELSGKAFTAVLNPRDCKDLKAGLTTLSRGLAASASTFFGTEGATEEEEDDDDGVYFRVRKKAKGEARIPEWDAAWIPAWWTQVKQLCKKKGIEPVPPTILLPSLPSHTSLPPILHTLHSLQIAHGIPFRLLFFSTTSELHELLPFRVLKLLEVQRERMGGGGEGVWGGWLGVPLVGGANPTRTEQESLQATGLEVGLGRRVMGFLVGRAADWEGGAEGIAAGLKFATMSHYYENLLSVLDIPAGCDIEAEVGKIADAIDKAGLRAEYLGLLAEVGAMGIARVIAASDPRFPPRKASPTVELLRLAASLPNYPVSNSASLDLRSIFLQVTKTLSAYRTHMVASWRALALFARETGLRLTSEGWFMLLEERLAGGTWWNRLWAEVNKWERGRWDSFLAKFAGEEGMLADKAKDLLERLRGFDESEEFAPRLPATVSDRRTTAQSRRVREEEAKRAMETGRGIDGWRAEAWGWFEMEIKEGIKSPHLVPFSEIWCFDNVATMEKHFAPPIRACLHTALGNPSSSYLACSCCPDDRLRSTMGDTSIAYRLHLEHGRMVNLADWAVQFRDVVLGGEDDDGDANEDDNEKEDKEQRAKEIHARFIRSASELQFLGLLKGTNRKKDHVIKQTF